MIHISQKSVINSKADLLIAMEELERRKKYNKIKQYYPCEGPLRRDLYVKHMAFFNAGSDYKERLMLSANRVGKTEGVGGYELTLHLTGYYPDWWKGRFFKKPPVAWAAGDTNMTVRDILQAKLLGPPGDWGSGLIPKDSIIKVTPKRGLSDAVEGIRVRHSSGGVSNLYFKSYEQKREAFQGTELDILWLDEEPPYDIYLEGVMRTMTTGGIVMLTFTPLRGISEVVLAFMPDLDKETADGLSTVGTTKFVVQAGWDDAPHLTEEQKQELLDSIPAWQQDARTRGIPQIGAGAIYPIPLDMILVDPFDIPPFWPRGYGLDVGWRKTAATWGVTDPGSGVSYLYSEHYLGREEPAIHAQAIRSRGDLPGYIDPASRGGSQKDGEKLMSIYRELGLEISPADNSVESGIFRVWQGLSSGTLKVFKTLKNWQDEYRLYHRDDNGKVVKKRDHLMDATRYAYVHKDSWRPPSHLKNTISSPGYGFMSSNYNHRSSSIGDIRTTNQGVIHRESIK